MPLGSDIEKRKESKAHAVFSKRQRAQHMGKEQKEVKI